MTDPKAIAQRNKQRERQQRGNDFQQEIRESWGLVPNVWRMRIADGGGSTRPADEIVLTENGNLLIEMKRTNGMRFDLSMLRPNQIKGLLDFEVIPQNYGLVFVSFLNETKGIDEAYVFRLKSAIEWMKKRERRSIDIDTLASAGDRMREGRNDPHSFLFRAIEIDRLESSSRYDLSGVVTCCKYL